MLFGVNGTGRGLGLFMFTMPAVVCLKTVVLLLVALSVPLCEMFTGVRWVISYVCTLVGCSEAGDTLRLCGHLLGTEKHE